MVTIIDAGLSARGRVRPHNEDRWFADSRQGLYVVSDGMGGHAAGSLPVPSLEIVGIQLATLKSSHLSGNRTG